uniref:Uncharacterized protein n=1 Tax=Cacopsylla melanoneura TaxID=428564 RepID=A0A8D8V959_9HEMI
MSRSNNFYFLYPIKVLYLSIFLLLLIEGSKNERKKNERSVRKRQLHDLLLRLPAETKSCRETTTVRTPAKTTLSKYAADAACLRKRLKYGNLIRDGCIFKSLAVEIT